MDVLIEKLNGQQKRFSELGIIPLDFLVSSTEIRAYTTQITGRPGNIDKGADDGPKSITVPFLFESESLMDYSEKRDEIYAWLGSKEKFWIYEGRSLGETRFEHPGESTGAYEMPESEINFSKRYLVRRTSTLNPSQKGTWGKDSISFETTDLPYAESTAFRHTTLTQSGILIINNNGTETVDPEEGMEMIIEYRGASSSLNIWEMPAGVKWEHRAPTVAGDVLRVDGINTTKNGLSAVRNTNFNVLKIRPGRNEYKVTGIDNGILTVSFREYHR